jgi:hypothetical protein
MLGVLSRNRNFLVFLSSFGAVSADFVPSLFKLSLRCFAQCKSKDAGDFVYGKYVYISYNKILGYELAKSCMCYFENDNVP